MEPSKKGGMIGGAEKIVAKFSEEQKRIFSNLSSVTSSKAVSSASCSRNQEQNIVKPPGSLEDCGTSSDDDCMIIDISDDDEKEVMLEDVSSEMSNESRKDENGVAAEPKVESDVESESEHDWEVITIEDDEEDKPKIPPPRMICYRCPSKKVGTFKDVKKYFAHIKRHVFPDHFACPICKRPFLKLNYCLSHELRIHGSSLECEIKDPVISMAKNYVNARKAKICKAGPSTRRMETDDGEDIDCEDLKFYDNRFVKSSSVYPYRGPYVTTILEAYEIQNFQPRKKANRVNGVARIALTVHKQNVQKEQDTYKLGRFSGRKGQRGKIVDPNAIKPNPKKKPAAAKPKQTTSKRARETASESEITAKEQPKKKKVRYAYITSSSSSSSESDSDNTTDADYTPSKKKRYEGTVSSSSQQQPGKVKYKKALPPILDRHCVKCKNFEWAFPDELRSHRDAVHPNTPLVDLMAVLCPEGRKSHSNKHGKKVEVKVAEKKEVNKKAAVQNNEKVVPAPAKKPGKKVPDTNKKEAKARKAADTKKGEKKAPEAGRVRIQRQGRSKVSRSQFPLPNSTYSQKELFLHQLGLSNCVRLHLHQKKPLEDLNLRPCSVIVQKLSDPEVAFYRNRGSMSSSLHNLLRGHFLAS